MATNVQRWTRKEWLKFGKEHMIAHVSIVGKGRGGNPLDLPFRKFLDGMEDGGKNVLSGQSPQKQRVNVSAGQEFDFGESRYITMTIGELRELIKETVMYEAVWMASPPKKYAQSLDAIDVEAENTNDAGDRAAKKWFDIAGIRVDPMTVDVKEKKENVQASSPIVFYYNGLLSRLIDLGYLVTGGLVYHPAHWSTGRKTMTGGGIEIDDDWVLHPNSKEAETLLSRAQASSGDIVSLRDIFNAWNEIPGMSDFIVTKNEITGDTD